MAPDTDEELAVDGTIDVGSDNASPPRENDLEQLRGPDDLAIFASDAIGALVVLEPSLQPETAVGATDGGTRIVDTTAPARVPGSLVDAVSQNRRCPCDGR